MQHKLLTSFGAVLDASQKTVYLDTCTALITTVSGVFLNLNLINISAYLRSLYVCSRVIPLKIAPSLIKNCHPPNLAAKMSLLKGLMMPASVEKGKIFVLYLTCKQASDSTKTR